ncbi:MAG: diguanylate cyclase [Lachnospiraceae bacterium]|nr:diguanylate cyclase [Lachnospiraceae bacterium]
MTKWIIVVDDDISNLKIAGHILSKNNIRVTALKSGKAFLEYVEEKGMPNLILLDVKMPEMDGFETLMRLRELEESKGLMKTPVVFLTADEDVDTETRGFEVGVADFIRKPFNPEVLLRRIDNVMSSNQEMRDLRSEASMDKLTGLLNKAATRTELSRICSNAAGCLMMIDLDSFKLVNDIYGHEMGDKVLITFSDLIRKSVPEGSQCGRIGGDEFVAFATGVTTEERVKEIAVKLNDDLVAAAKRLMGEDMVIPLGTSVGAIFVPRYGNDYASLLKLADKALYNVKKYGKHGYELYDEDAFDEGDNVELDIKAISEILGERSIPDVALQLDREAFAYVYRYVIRYAIRHNIQVCKVLFTLNPADGEPDAAYANLVDEFGTHIRKSLRKSDIFMRNNKKQYFVFLSDVREDSYRKVAEHIVASWEEKHNGELRITYSTEFVKAKNEGTRL